MIDCHVHVVSPNPCRYPLQWVSGDDSAQAHVVTYAAENLLAEQSDYPASPEPSYADAIDLAREVLADSGSQERDLILSGNTRRPYHFGIPRQAGDDSNGS